MKHHRSQFAIEQDLAEELRSVFTEYYRRKEQAMKGTSNWTPGPYWDGGNYRGTKRSSVWGRAAKLLAKEGFPVRSYVHYVVFEHRPSGLPRPDMLASKKVVAGYRQWQTIESETMKERLREAFLTEAMIADNKKAWYREMMENGIAAFSAETIARSIVADTTHELSPLFRYCLADMAGIADLQEEFLEPAARQYLCFADLYDEIYGKMLPENFRRLARRSLPV